MFMNFPVKSLKELYFKNDYNPSWVGIFTNPFYLIRLSISKNVRECSPKHSVGKILDVGCGKKPYRLFFDCKSYTGIDIENPGHPHHNEEIDVFYDGKNIPFPDQEFDIILSFEVFEHVEQLDELITELNRVLKINGSLIITAPFIWDEHELPHDYRRFTNTGLCKELEKHNFEIIESHKMGNSLLTLIQLMNLQAYNISCYSRYFLFGVTLLFIAPFTLIGLLINFLLPTEQDPKLYFGSCVVARKKQN